MNSSSGIDILKYFISMSSCVWCVHVHLCVKVKGEHQGSSSDALHLVLFSRVSLSLELTNWARLTCSDAGPSDPVSTSPALGFQLHNIMPVFS